jgi:hypothetical protein
MLLIFPFRGCLKNTYNGKYVNLNGPLHKKLFKRFKLALTHLGSQRLLLSAFLQFK